MDHYLRDELYERVRTDPELFEFLQAGSLDGIWYWDIERPEEEWLSPRFKEVFGYRDDEVPNTSEWWQVNIHPDDLAKAIENFELHCADPEHAYDQIVRYRHKNGSLVWVRCRGIAIRENGRPIRMLGAHTDVTELKLAEQRIQALNEELAAKVEELELTNRALDEFAGIASHDLKEPARGISLQVRILLDDHGSELGEEARTRLERLAQTGDRLRNIVDSLLEYSRLGRADVGRDIVDLEEVLAQVLLVHEVLLREAEIEVRRPSELPNVRCDEASARTVLMNLISNAIKYRSEDRPWIEIGVEGEALYVRDNGIGIPKKHKLRIFEIFKRLHGREERGGGLGVGLSFVRRIVEGHGGDLRLESEPGEGSTFYFTLGERVPTATTS